VIACGLLTGIKSDRPGAVMGSVYDGAFGKRLLIPQGSRTLGCYNGQRRVQAVWNRIILAGTSSLTLGTPMGVDLVCYVGLEDGVDRYWDGVFAAVMLATLLDVGAEMVAPGATG